MKTIFSLFFALATLSAHAGLTIGAYNIRNFDYDERYKIRTNKVELATILMDLNFDVLSVEEIHDTGKWDEFVQTKLPGFDTEVSRCGGDHGQHLGFVYNKSTVELLSFNEDLSITNPGTPGACDSGSRPLAIGLFRIKATGQKFYGLTAHLKSGSRAGDIAKREKQYNVIKDVIAELKDKTGVQDFYLAGDLNTTEYLKKGNDYKQLTRVVSELGMVDLSHKLGCSAYWWGGTDDGIEEPSLLDHVIATPGLIKAQGAKAETHAHCKEVNCRQVPIKELGISYESVSDHCPITATIQ